MRRIPIILVLSAPLVACGAPTVPDEAATEEGPIVARDVEMDAVRAPSIHVRAPSEECGVVFGLSEAKVLRRLADGRLVEADRGELEVGRQVKAWARDGIVLESCPGQAPAETVVLLYL